MTSPLRSRILSGSVLAIALTLAACGGGSGDEPTPTPPPATTAAKPTQPPVNVPASPTAPADLVVSTPTSTVSVDSGTPVVVPVTPDAISATPIPAASPVAGETWVVSDTPGDGTGGAGSPGEGDSDEPASATPEAVASPVAELTIEGCEVPHVPNYVGGSDQGALTEDVNFRSGPGVDCDPLQDNPLEAGQTVTITGGPVTQAADDSTWLEIDIDGTRGWISADYVDVTP